MAQIDYSSVHRYWDQVKPSMLGPYMMEGFGFPAGAGRFRFKEEQRIVDRLISRQNSKGRLLDLGCGIGQWAEHFAENFSEVVAVDGSQPFHNMLKERTKDHTNISAILCNVMEYSPTGKYEVIFLGGLLMYLNQEDVILLLQRLSLLLNPGGIILCRESTVINGSESLKGEYQVTYRSKRLYCELFLQCDLSLSQSELNTPYVLLQMGCELMQTCKRMIPDRFGILKLLGHLVYGVLRLTNPWIIRIPPIFGCSFPRLKNHFFMLKRKPENISPETSRNANFSCA